MHLPHACRLLCSAHPGHSKPGCAGQACATVHCKRCPPVAVSHMRCLSCRAGHGRPGSSLARPRSKIDVHVLPHIHTLPVLHLSHAGAACPAERMPATVSQGVRQPGPPAPQAVRRTSPDSNTSASTPMDAGCQLMPSGGATASQAPAATGTGTPAPTGSGGGATPATAGGGGASAGGSASAGSDPVKPGRPRAAGHVESTAQRAQDRPDITLPGWMQEDQARLLSAQRSECGFVQ